MKEYRPKFLRKVALLLAGIMLLEAIFPVVALALTSGPSQPEMQGFQPIGTTDMVDLFTGNFSYNIPLCDVDGYPLNLSYQSDPGMDDEASWVGLGWSLNPGVMNREVRGYPDDFKEENIIKEFNMRPNVTVGISGRSGVEFFGMFGAGFNKGIRYNNYRGFGNETGLSAALSIGLPNKKSGSSDTSTKVDTTRITFGLNLSSDGNGLNADAFGSLGFPKEAEKLSQFNLRTSYNSRQGLKDLTFQGTNNNADELTPSLNLSSSYDFGSFSYFPTSPLPLFNDSYTLNLKAGGEVFGIFGNAGLTGYYTKQQLIKNRDRQYAYGYLYLNEADEGRKEPIDWRGVLLDYNSEKKGVIREEMPNIPLSYGAYDLFTASGQGISGQFRAVRNDLGLLYPAYTANQSNSSQLGGEVGGGAIFKTGFDADVAESITTTKAWKKNNAMAPYLQFTSDEKFYESVFFKNVGEPTPTDPNFRALLGGDNPNRTDLSLLGNTIGANRIFASEKRMRSQSKQAVNSVIKRESRESRNQVFSYLTSAEAANVGLDKDIRNYRNGKVLYADSDVEANPIPRTNHPDHHISETNILQSDGSRYVYGIPAYNHKQREVTFSVDPPAPSDSTFDQTSTKFGLVSYQNGKDNSVHNKKGQENYFDATEIPAYAHSYLLTAVLSPDYVDRTGNGITEDDSGNAVKLNYSRVHENFKWRMPYQENKARYQEGYQSWDKDDKASYLYGEKEVWNLHSIESRTMVAQFYTSKRNDGLGVSNENGGQALTDTLVKLDSIKLFSKSDLIANQHDATPIKWIHFEYEEDTLALCSGIPNTAIANGGKLTLKRVYFTYGNSERGQLNAYEFSYQKNKQDSTPFKYNMLHTDRWGRYKQNPTGYPRNDEFPYALQDPTYIDDYAASWNLNSIDLPSGGKIRVSYESDDYAYVQDKRAGQMFFIEGFASDINATIQNQLFTLQNGNNDYIVIGNIPSNILNENQPLKRYFEDVEKLYFRSKVDLSGEGDWEYVSGYMDFDRSGVQFHNNRLYIPVNNLGLKGAVFGSTFQVHPIALAAFQLMRLELPHLVYPDYDLSDGNVGKIIKSFLGFGFVKDIQRLSQGFEQQAILEGKGRLVDLSNSWVRLSNPTFKKFGGGSRVKQVVLSDQWTGGGSNSEYGQVYTYETTQQIAGKNVTMSSGVAAYEPLMGGEENLMKNPLPYREKILLAPDNFYYTETPVGESLFPGPTVGYSNVKVESISNEVVDRTGTGYSISEFYTAKDFPVRVDMTQVAPVRIKPNIIARFFKINVQDLLGMSQGFVIEVNDMHGKPKSNFTYDHSESLLARTDYHYRTDGEADESQALKNTVSVIDNNNSISKAEIGVDVEVWQEMVEENSTTTGLGVAANADGFFIPPFLGLVVPTPIPIFQRDQNQLRTAATTKFIKRYGMLDKVTVMENGSTVTTENLLYDQATGSVLLTKTQNEFDDAMYQFNYPAHWTYDGMGQAYKNINSIFSADGIDEGELQSPVGFDPLVDLVPGDEIIIQQDGQNGIESDRYWVTKPGSSMIIMDRAGQPLTLNNPLSIKVIRSGRRNQAGATIGSFTARVNPIDEVADEIAPAANDAILDAGALTFMDRWQMLCANTEANGIPIPSAGDTINPYVEGMRGNWRPHTSYIFYGDRTPDVLPTNNGETNIREDGTIKDFVPFWSKTGGNAFWQSNPNNGWTLSNEITSFDQRGNEIENEDALGIASGALFGYDQNRVVAVAGNARQSEMAVDGFEDYDFQDTASTYRTLQFTDNTLLDITDEAAHSGKHSLRISGQGSVRAQTLGDSCGVYILPLACIDVIGPTCGPNGGLTVTLASNCVENQNYNSLTYSWDMGDGTQLSGDTISHLYTNPGATDLSYTINLTVTDEFGNMVQSSPGVTVVIKPAGESCTGQTIINPGSKTDANAKSALADFTAFTNQCSDCLPKLSPEAGKPSWFSIWVASNTSIDCGQAPLGDSVVIRFTRESLPNSITTLTSSGPVIEGWQKIEGKIDVPADYVSLEITLFNTLSGTEVYYDDFRFHPWQSNMQSYVYDPASMRLMATLDENNYANFYEYDDEGILVRVKRETEKGVMTVQESRTVLRK